MVAGSTVVVEWLCKSPGIREIVGGKRQRNISIEVFISNFVRFSNVDDAELWLIPFIVRFSHGYNQSRRGCG